VPSAGWSAASTIRQAWPYVLTWRREGVVVHGLGGDAGADEDGVGAEPAHQLELVPGAPQVAGEDLFRDRLDVPHRLVEVDAQAEVGRAGGDLLGGERARQEVVLEDLDAVEAGP
jgi:hypothetical protein